jgi:small subunit ribosomal protein S6
MMRKVLIIMPRYELMYIVASSVSDDQIPTVIDGVLNLIKGDGGTVVREEGLGKKKLAYPIEKTRNGFYDLVTFDIDGEKLNALSTKIQNSEGIIRHLIVNTEEATKRAAKDIASQEKMNRNREERAKTAEANKVVEPTTAEAVASSENIDQKIEDALNEDLDKI